MQPDTTPLKLARDIAAFLSKRGNDCQSPNEQRRNGDNLELEHAHTEASNHTSGPGSQIEVIPLYTPEGSAIKFFCVHPSHRYAMSLVPISTGFQGQVIAQHMRLIVAEFSVFPNLSESATHVA